jgi:hypothetical protein
VNAAAEGGKWEPAAEILSARFSEKSREGSLRHLVAASYWLLALSLNLPARTASRNWKNHSLQT